MRIDLVFPVLPPALDGIGDHTALLAQGLRDAGASVRVHTAQADPTSIPGVPILQDFSVTPPRAVEALVEAVAADPPDWLFVQFNQFSYGRYGFNPWLPLTLHRLRRRVPALKVAWMAHEDFVPAVNWKFAVMTLWQRAQFWTLGRQADHIFFSIDPWVQRYGAWFPDTPVTHLPAGSNMPRLALSREEARRRVGVPADAVVAGLFGTLAGNARDMDAIEAALTALHREIDTLVVLYVGPHGPLLRERLPGLPLRDAGRLPAPDVSVHLRAMDLHLSPFVDGLSTRRGSALAGLQHGVATVSTDGPLTDRMIRAEDGRTLVLTPVGAPEAFAAAAVRLARTPGARRRLGARGRRFFDTHFDWRVLADRVLSSLSAAPSSSVNAPSHEGRAPASIT